METILKKYLRSGRGDETEPYKETTLDSNSIDYITLRMAVVNSAFVVKIHRITTVKSPYLHGCFLLKKAEYQSRGQQFTVKQLYHDTAADNIPSILEENLDWRLVNRHKFGRGVSFSPSMKYANQQSSRSNGTDRAMIIADVLVGNTYPGNEGITLPPSGNYDTTTGNLNSVYVKFYDNEFYPKHVIYYESAPHVYRRRFRF